MVGVIIHFLLRMVISRESSLDWPFESYYTRSSHSQWVSVTSHQKLLNFTASNLFFMAKMQRSMEPEKEKTFYQMCQ